MNCSFSYSWIETNRILDLLHDGVAFKHRSHRFYQVYSHEGDHLADVPTCDVEHALFVLRRLGRAVTNVSNNSLLPALTTAF